jgi:hypothetical protein
MYFDLERNGKRTFFPQSIITGLIEEGICNQADLESLPSPISEDSLEYKDFSLKYPKIHTVKRNSSNKWNVGDIFQCVAQFKDEEKVFSPEITITSLQYFEIRLGGLVFIDGKEVEFPLEFALREGFGMYRYPFLAFLAYLDDVYEFNVRGHGTRPFTGTLVHWSHIKYHSIEQ